MKKWARKTVFLVQYVKFFHNNITAEVIKFAASIFFLFATAKTYIYM